MAELEVEKEYWFKGRVKEVDMKDGKMPYRVNFGGWTTLWLPASEVVETIPEREKAVLYRPVADWLTACKGTGATLEYAISEGIKHDPDGISEWLQTCEGQDTFARAWLDGFEVDKESLYWVRDDKGKSILYKDVEAGGKVTRSGGSNVSHQERHSVKYTFTEQEIKAYDERFWAFAVPVEEEE